MFYIVTPLTAALLLVMMVTPGVAHVDPVQQPVVDQQQPMTFAEKHQRIKALWQKSREADSSCWTSYYAREAHEAEQDALQAIQEIRTITGDVPPSAIPLLGEISTRNQPGSLSVSDLALLISTQCDLETGDSSPPAS